MIGDRRPLREIVTEMIDRHGGRPRRDSVECVELLLGASPEYFTEGRDRVNPERVRAFAGQTVEFLREQYGERCVKAVLHLDEKTPHVQAFMVPIDERGRLNCKRFFGSREKLRQFQDAFAAKMRPLGLERGVAGSRATHTDVQRFYGAIKQEVRLRVHPERVPDPPRVLVTEASRQEYKQQVITAVTAQLHEPVNTLARQAQLAREEKGQREAAEKRVAEAERREHQWADRFLAEQKENIAFHHRTRELTAEIAAARQQHSALQQQVEHLGRQVQTLTERVQDILLPAVMRALGYRGEQHDSAVIYRDAQGKVALTLTEGKAAQGNHVVARNAIELTIYIRQTQRQAASTPRDAIAWLADTFGQERAVAAAVAWTEQQTCAILQERQREMEPAPHREQLPEHSRARIHEPEHGFSR